MTLGACMIVGHPSFLGNRFFSEDPAVMRDNCSDMYVRLRRNLFERGIELNTEDITPHGTARLIFQLNVPRHELTVRSGQVAYLILGEPATVSARNWDRRRHRPYLRVLTWSDDLADGHKYLLVRNGYDLTVEFGDRAFRDRRFCTMIASARRSSHNLSLYAERDVLVRWMSQHRAHEFDPYGRQWPSSLRPVLPPQLEHRLPALVRRSLDAFYPPIRVYRGPVFSKREVLQRYRFSISFENMRDTRGYVTEKIFDSMCAGCVPVYWGASNIADLVPPDCFIDRRRFRDTAELVAYLEGITAEDFARFQSRIRDFLSSPAAAPFRGTSFAEAVTGVVVEDLGLPR